MCRIKCCITFFSFQPIDNMINQSLLLCVAKICRRHRCKVSVSRWILGAVCMDPCSVVANALSIPPGEYICKNETQRN